jgi:hypothetical protein
MPFAITISLVNLGLYCVQQFGMAIAVGAETVLLVAYLQSIQDRVVDDEEKGFARATRKVMDYGLFFIIVSGVGVVGVQFFATHQLTAFSTIFLFKWSLIGIVLFMSLANRGTSLTAGLLQGLAAGTWYALFVVHILAPKGTWVTLGEFYAAWLIGFMVCWTLTVFTVRLTHKPMSIVAKPASVPPPAVVLTPDRKAAPPVAMPVTSPMPPPPPKPMPPPITTSMPAPPPVPPAPAVVLPPPLATAVASAVVPPPAPAVPLAPVAAPVAPASPQIPLPPPPPAQASAQKPANAPEFIGLHVMPRTVEEVERHKDPA